MPKRALRPGPGLIGGWWIGLVLVGCVGSDPAVTPESVEFLQSRASGSLAAVSPPGAMHRSADLTTTADTLLTTSCGFVTVTAGQPERLRRGTCQEQYLVDFSVETEAMETPILDMFLSYDMVDWRIRTVGRRVTHEFALVWDPYADATEVGAEWRVARHVTQPLTVHICPGGGGMVLACSDTSCDTYAREDEVPPVQLPSQGFVLGVPWGPDDVQDLREGSTLEVPVSYRLRPGGEAIITMYRYRKSSRQLHITPREASRSGSGTVVFRLRAERDAIAQEPIVEEFWIKSVRAGGLDGCKVEPPWFRVRVRDR